MPTAVVSAKQFAHFIVKASKGVENASERVAKARVCERSERVFLRLEVLGVCRSSCRCIDAKHNIQRVKGVAKVLKNNLRAC
jgi:hypothetical protein